jgi:hypothetical protein
VAVSKPRLSVCNPESLLGRDFDFLKKICPGKTVKFSVFCIFTTCCQQGIYEFRLVGWHSVAILGL